MNVGQALRVLRVEPIVAPVPPRTMPIAPAPIVPALRR
jgi:hypothetical protein